MRRRVLTWAMVTVVAGFAAGAALAQFARTEDAVKYRQSVMFVIGQHFSRMGAVVKGEQPYAKEAFAQNAELVAALVKLPWEAFMTPDSAKGSGLQPDALAQKDQFLALARANEAETAKLAAAARGGDLSAAKPAFGAAGGSCKACHDAYRRK